MKVTINCCMRFEDGKAPTEADVAAMYDELEQRRIAKGYKQQIGEDRLYWDNAFQSDAMIFGIFKDYDNEIQN